MNLAFVTTLSRLIEIDVKLFMFNLIAIIFKFLNAWCSLILKN